MLQKTENHQKVLCSTLLVDNDNFGSPKPASNFPADLFSAGMIGNNSKWPCVQAGRMYEQACLMLAPICFYKFHPVFAKPGPKVELRRKHRRLPIIIGQT